MGQLYGRAVPAAGRNSAVLVYSSSQAEAGAKLGLACRCHAHQPSVCRWREHAQLNPLPPCRYSSSHIARWCTLVYLSLESWVLRNCIIRAAAGSGLLRASPKHESPAAPSPSAHRTCLSLAYPHQQLSVLRPCSYQPLHRDSSTTKTQTRLQTTHPRAPAWLPRTAALRSAWPQWPPTLPTRPSSRAGTTATLRTATACSSRTLRYRPSRRACRCAPNPTRATTTGRCSSPRMTTCQQTAPSTRRSRPASPSPPACRRRRCWAAPSRDWARRSRRARWTSTTTGPTTSSCPPTPRAA